jgi:hypothetical protein
MTIVGDIAQSTSAYARQNWSQALKELESDLPASLEVLDMGYRVPRQVFEVAAKVLSVAAPDIPAPQVLRDVLESPRWFVAAPNDLGAQVVDAVQEHSAKGLFVGVVANEMIWPELQKSFRARGTRWSESADGGLSQGINLVTPEDSKGLEFDAVVVVDPQRILNETQGARLLYVALTRTVHFLDVIMPEGKVPEILAGFLPQGSSESDPQDLPSCTEEDVVAHDDTEGPEEAPIPVRSPGALEPVEPPVEPSKGSRTIPDLSVPLARARDEAYAQLTADEIYTELQQTAGPAIQRRVVDLLRSKLGGSLG